MKLDLESECRSCDGRGWTWGGRSNGWRECLSCDGVGRRLGEDGKDVAAFLEDNYGLTMKSWTKKEKPDWSRE